MADCGSDDEWSEASGSDWGPQWLLGFVKKARHTSLLRHRFPCKVGGRPAWLHPLDLPQEQQIRCEASGRWLEFLLQIYSPVDGIDAAFHRMIYVFISPKGSDLRQQGGARAFRCQLPRDNAFYSSEPPRAGQVLPPALPEEFSASDRWKVAEAERLMAEGSELAAPAGVQLFPEYELVVDAEPEETDVDKERIQRLINTYNKTQCRKGNEDDLSQEDLGDIDSTLGPEQKSFAEFSARVARAPGQCVRYCYEDGVTPLWPCHSNRPTSASIPDCQRCGAPRKFEFQILPQLVNFLDVEPEDPDGPDWGCLGVYTCSASCSPDAASAGATGSAAYAEEFVWLQPA